PLFAPRWSAGDPSGLDRNRWKSFVQKSFSGGAGQKYFSGPSGNNRFAESSGVDINEQDFVSSAWNVGTAGRRRHRTIALGIGEVDAGGPIRAALTPRATTAADVQYASNFNEGYPVHVFEYSNKPLIVHNLHAAAYTNIVGPDAFKNPGEKGHTDPLTGEWAVAATWDTNEGQVQNAVMYSGIVEMAKGLPARANTLEGIHVMGAVVESTWINSVMVLQPTVTTVYAPAYATEASLVHVYDKRLWRSYQGNLAFLTPTQNTVP
ncbi:unnamed protein product, partial [marine sediment metagenome]